MIVHFCFLRTVRFARYRRRAKRMYLLCKVFLAFNLLFGTSTCIIKKSLLAFFLKINLFRPLNIWVKITLGYFFLRQWSIKFHDIENLVTLLVHMSTFVFLSIHTTLNSTYKKQIFLHTSFGQKTNFQPKQKKIKKNWSFEIKCGIFR